METLFRKVTTDDFHTIGELNNKRIEAYNKIANDYNIDLGTIRDIFSLGINFAVANMEEIKIPSDEEILQKVLTKQDKDQTQFMRGIDYILGFINNKK